MRWLAALASFAMVLGGDLITKSLATDELGGGRIVELPLGVRLNYGENTGIAFGLLAGSGDVVLFVALIAVLAIALALLRTKATVAPLAVGAVFGGAIANLVDRSGDGAVTDFIDVGPWPSFNLADAAITVGVVALVLTFGRGGEVKEAEAPPPTAGPRGGGA